MQKIIDLSTCSFVNVTVYPKKAKITRLINTQLDGGENEIVVQGFPRVVDQDTVRVDGKANATLLEVQYKEESVETTPKVTIEPDAELLAKKEVLEADESKLLSLLQRTTKRKSYLEEFIKEYIKRIFHRKKELPFDDNIPGSCLAQFELLAERMDCLALEANAKLKTITKQLTEMSLHHSPEKEYEIRRNVHILINSTKKQSAEFTLVYTVSRASWIPKYDLHLDVAQKKMTIHYYGMITQTTGEDWKNAQVFLSTTQVNVEKKCPQLELVTVNSEKPDAPKIQRQPQHKTYKSKKRQTRNPLSPPLVSSTPMLESPFHPEYRALICNDDSDGSEPPPVPAPPIQNMTTTVVSSVDVNATFLIPRKCTIPSDSNGHKLTISILNFDADIIYEIVPSKSSDAFLTGKIKNTSAFTLIAGDVSVFMENNFVAKDTICNVSPGEEYTSCSIIDPSVRIINKPQKRTKVVRGAIKKSNHESFEYVVDVKNMKSSKIKVKLLHNLPQSLQPEICKVILIEPVKLKNNGNQVKLIDKSIIEWITGIESQKSKLFTIKYEICYPVGELLNFS